MTWCMDLSKYMCTAKHISTPLASVYVGERNENFLLYMAPHDGSARLENSMRGRFFSEWFDSPPEKLLVALYVHFSFHHVPMRATN